MEFPLQLSRRVLDRQNTVWSDLHTVLDRYLFHLSLD